MLPETLQPLALIGLHLYITPHDHNGFRGRSAAGTKLQDARFSQSHFKLTAGILSRIVHILRQQVIHLNKCSCSQNI